MIAKRIDQPQVLPICIGQIDPARADHYNLPAVGREDRHGRIFTHSRQAAQASSIDIDYPDIPRRAVRFGHGGRN